MIEFLFYILFPLLIGIISSILSNSSLYMEMIKPALSPPSIVFPIVWTILFILMGISSYLVRNNKKSITIYIIQLLFNSFWTLIFFNLKMYFLAVIWIIILIILVILMIIIFYKNNKLAGLLQIPYLLWLFFALYLSYNVYLLN